MLLESALTLAVASSAVASVAIVRGALKRRLRRVLKRLGEEQGLAVVERVERAGLKFDLAWKREGDGRLTHVFVLDGMKPPKAIGLLKRAYELWGVRGFYVANGRRAKEAAKLLKEAFPEANGHVWVLTKGDVKELARLRSKYGRVLEELKPAEERAPLGNGTGLQEAGAHGCFGILPAAAS